MLNRSFSFVLSALLLLLLSPLFLLIMLLIKIDSSGPVLYFQERVGKGGKLFYLFKFRSMVTGADKKGPYYTKDNDQRITRIGSILRKSSIDELPQLFNVLRGEMNFIGPRPDVPQQRELYDDDEWQVRCSVAPGITGLAQVVRRSEATIKERKDLDLLYVHERSWWLDCKIILLTVRQILTKGGH